jgi:hypothetical protein
MKYEEKLCESCGKIFLPKSSNQYGIQKYCSEECHKKRKERQNKKKHSKIPEKQKKKKDVILLNGINSEYKLITRWKNLAEDVLRIMNPDKLNKYSKQTKDFCLEIKYQLYKKLKEQIEKRDVIIVNMED